MRAVPGRLEHPAHQAALAHPLRHDLRACERSLDVLRDSGAAVFGHRRQRYRERVFVRSGVVRCGRGPYRRARPEQPHRIDALIGALDGCLASEIDHAVRIGDEECVRQKHRICIPRTAQADVDALPGPEPANSNGQGLVHQGLIE
jgi:hypothetical protein